MQEIPKRPDGDVESYSKETILQEMIRCSDNTPGTKFGLLYWINGYAKILDNNVRGWIDFDLWTTEANGYDNQVTVAIKMQNNKRHVVLKARQLGLTWLVLAVFLWSMLFYPIATVLFISRSEADSIELMTRIRGMYNRLPTWMRAESMPASNKKEWVLSNGSSARSLSTRRGDSFTASHVLVDEADLIHEAGIDLADVLLKVEPTVGRGGMLVLLSKPDKSHPQSTFKNIVRSAMKGETDYIFSYLPYYVHPARDEAWYEQQKINSLAIDGSLDALHENYSSTPEEAMAPRSSSKRLPHTLLSRCYDPMEPLVRIHGSEAYWCDNEVLSDDIPMIHGLCIYQLPDDKYRYLIIIDPAEGGGDSDDSAVVVLRLDNKEEVATLAIKAEPADISYHADKLAHFYGNAYVIHERNNHGHAVKLWFDDHSDFNLLPGWDFKDDKPGWLSNSFGKHLGYDKLAESLAVDDCIIHDADTYAQLASIERATLRAPKSEPDDRAVCFMIGVAAIEVGCIREFSIDFINV